MSIQVKISNVAVTLFGSPQIHDVLDQRGSCTFVVHDPTGLQHYMPGQPVTVTDTANPLGGFIGYINDSSETKLLPNPDILSMITCVDEKYLATKRVAQKDYVNQYAGDIGTDLLSTYLSAEGVTSNYAYRRDTTMGNFQAGVRTGTVGTTNVGDGDLELSLAGSNVTNTDSGVSLPATTAIKLTGYASVPGLSDLYVYKKIFAGNVTLSGGDYIQYDMWISTTSPEIKAGIDVVFTDGTILRGQPQSVSGTDQQGLTPYPGNDYTGLADNQWYTRVLGLSSSLTSKHVQYVTVGFECTKTGQYTAYFRNISIRHSNGSLNTTIFNGTLLNPAADTIANSAFTNVALSVVPTYDKSVQTTTSNFSMTSVGIARTSFLAYTASSDVNITSLVESTLDGQTTWQACTNRGTLGSFVAGQNLSGINLKLRYTITNTGPYPEIAASINSVTFTVFSSYAATKTDVPYTVTNFSTGTTTTLNGSASGLTINGFQRLYDDANYSNQAFFGAAGASQSLIDRQFSLSAGNTIGANYAASRLDFAGNWLDFIAEVDINISNTNDIYGLIYLTPSANWNNNQNTYAYVATISANEIYVARGSNGGAGGGALAFATVGLSLSTGTVHRLRVQYTSSTKMHDVYLDGVQYIHSTDTTGGTAYNATGRLGFYYANGGAATNSTTFDNFGVALPLTGTWVSPSQSISSVGTIGNSVIYWQASVPDTSTLLIETSYNGGAYQTATNGGAIPGATPGTSASGKTVQVRATLTAGNTSMVPLLTGLSFTVLGQYSSSGTRVSPALSLAPVGRAGSTLVSWNGNVPTNTSISIDTSLDGSTFTNVGTVTNATPGSANIANITYQPDPMDDTFTADSSANYTTTNTPTTGTAATSWTWDTSFSRVEVIGGTKALCLYNALTTVTDVDMTVDSDTSNAGGMVWRVVDLSHYYELDFLDSNSAVIPSVLRLFKIVGGARNQLGSNAPIPFTQGTVGRIRMTMIGGVITAYFNGVQALTYTDASPLGAGQCGLSNNGGNANYYQLRIQPLGQDVTSLSVYTRATLTSTDPTITPQLLDLTVSVHNPNIQNGVLIPVANYSVINGSSKTIGADFDDLAAQSNYTWRIRNKQMYFQARNANLSPFVITGTDMLFSPQPTIDDIQNLYRNSQWVQGGTDLIADVVTKVGDGVTQDWIMNYPVDSVQSITINGVPALVGIQGIDTGKDFYYQQATSTISQDKTEIPFVPAQTIVFNYTGQVPVVVNVNNGDLISQRATLEGTSGIVEVVEAVPNLNKSAATTLAQGRIIQYGVTGKTATFTTNRTGLAVGQLLTIFLPEHNIFDEVFLITDVTTTWQIVNTNGVGVPLAFYKVVAEEGAIAKLWTTTMAGL